MKKAINAVYRGMGWFEESVSMTALTITVVVTVINVFARYIFKSSIPWAQEVSGFCWTWTVMLGISWAYRRNMHMGIDMLVMSLGKRAKQAVYILCYAILLVAFAYMTYMSVIIAQLGDTKLTSYFQLPYTYKYVSAVIAFAFMVIYTLRYLYIAVTNVDEFLARVSIDGNGLDNLDITEEPNEEVAE